MRVLSISLDKGLFDKKSDVFWRHQDYSSWVDKYFVIIPTLKNENKKPSKEKNLEVSPTNSLSRFLYLVDIVFTAWKNRGSKFDLVTVQDPFLCGLAGIGIKYLLKIPLNMQIHSEFFNSPYFRQESLFNFLCFYLGLFTLGFADTVRARNSRIKMDLARRFPHLFGKIGCVGVRLNEIYLRPLSPVKRDRNLILTVGRNTPQKNFPLLLKAAGIARRTRPKLKLLQVGQKNWLPPQKINQKLARLYEKAGVFALSSNHEGWNLAALEALARGCPVVMTNTGCAEEIVVHNRTGYIVPVGDAEALAKGIVEVLSNTDKYQKLALTGRKLVLRDSNKTFIKESMLRMFRATLQQQQNLDD